MRSAASVGSLPASTAARICGTVGLLNGDIAPSMVSSSLAAGASASSCRACSLTLASMRRSCWYSDAKASRMKRLVLSAPASGSMSCKMDCSRPRNSSADWKRSAGSGCSALATASESACGHSGSTELSAGISGLPTFPISSPDGVSSKGFLPVTSSQSTRPTA